MSFFLDAVVPGPWWNSLTYKSEEPISQGVRVRVPVGKTSRVAFVLSSSEKPSWDGEIRPVLEVLDEGPIFPKAYWDLMSWVGKAFLCGIGQAMTAMVPPEILKGFSVDPWLSKENQSLEGSVETFYRFDDSDRTARYMDVISGARAPILVAFPEQERARAFFKIADKAFQGGLFWSKGSGASKISKWKAVRDEEISYVVGGPGVLTAPFTPGTVIIEDESSPAYRLQKGPRLNVRSVLSRLALSSKGLLILGGRVPSSRVFKELSPLEDKTKNSRLVFVNTWDCLKIEVPGMSKDIVLSQGVMERTAETLLENRVVLWILDRKGYSGELHCAECEAPLRCPCGGLYRYIAGDVTCFRCGKTISMPERCPACGGMIIVGRTPGLEAYMPLAGTLASQKPLLLWTLDEPRGSLKRKEALKSLVQGGLVLGTRKALELCDCLDIGLICWLDGDAEARRPDHGARFNAYSMTLESCWRGVNPEKRLVLFQSRGPNKGWQKALTRGFGDFWRRELPERSDMDLPPFRYLAKIHDMGEDKDKIRRSLGNFDTEVMDPGGDILWVGFDRISKVRRAMEGFYAIGAKSYPKIVLFTD